MNFGLLPSTLFEGNFASGNGVHQRGFRPLIQQLQNVRGALFSGPCVEHSAANTPFGSMDLYGLIGSGSLSGGLRLECALKACIAKAPEEVSFAINLLAQCWRRLATVVTGLSHG